MVNDEAAIIMAWRGGSYVLASYVWGVIASKCKQYSSSFFYSSAFDFLSSDTQLHL